jgi:glycosyltransferase involved in cell wall biosynthesis
MSEKLPEVTVLMGVFNGLPHLDLAIRSILNQTFRDFEFVIIDDASTDGSDRVIAKYAATDARIRFVANERNAGLGTVLHRGVHGARGTFIARMDADDASVPQRLERQVEFLRTHQHTDIVGSYALDVTEDGVPVRERRVPTAHERIVKLIWSCPIIHPTVMFRRESILRAGSYSPALRRRQDYELWFRCVRDGLGFANIPEPLVHYLYSEHTIRRNNFGAAWHQVKVGLRGCRMINASLAAYVATCLPLLEAMVPRALRMRLGRLKTWVDPRMEAGTK